MNDAIDTVAATFADWNAHDLDAVYGRLAEDYSEHLNGRLAKSSRAEARTADEALYGMFPNFARTVEELWGSGHRVVSRFIITGSTTEGEPFELAIAAIFGIRDGQVAEAHLFFDPATAFEGPSG